MKLFAPFFRRGGMIALTLVMIVLGIDAVFREAHMRWTEIEGALPLSPVEDTLALVLVAFGVFLEEREELYRHIFGHSPDVREEALNRDCFRFGAVMLMSGLFVEMFDQLQHMFAAVAEGLHAFGIALIFFFQLVGFIALVGFLLTLLRRPGAAA